MRIGRRFATRSAAIGAGAVLILAAAGLGIGSSYGGGSDQGSSPPRVVGDTTGAAPTGADALSKSIAALQSKLREDPSNAGSWATLGLDYVQQAKITVNPAYYPKAAGVLAKSLALQPADNFLADGGMAALTAARHDFTAARVWAKRGLAIDPYNPTLYGALDDAETQLGNYPAAFDAVQHMLDVRPGTPAFTRAEYVFELRGQIPQAKAEMQRALQAAPTPADQAFAYYYLAQLDFDNGDPTAALASLAQGTRADAAYPDLLEGRAKAEAALGQNAKALADYDALVNRVPQPMYVVEYGELLESLGRIADAHRQYDLFLTEEKLFESNGVALDVDPTLFYADHGDPKTALRYGVQGLKIRPFLEMDDAYAWALHKNHRDREALTYEHKALALGTRNALFHFHLGMIDSSLGDVAGARHELATALAMNPHFNPLQAPVARKALAALGGAK